MPLPPSAPPPEDPEASPEYVLAASWLVEGGMLAAAFLFGALTGVWPLQGDLASPRSYLLGAVAALPLAAAMALIQIAPNSWFGSVHAHSEAVVRPTLGRLHWSDLALLAALAGLGEEAFFRGFLQQSLMHWGSPWFAVAASSLLFGLLHWASPLFAFLAFLASLYLGWVMVVAQDLVVVVVAHALYDFGALLYISQIQPGAEEGDAERGGGKHRGGPP